MVSAVCGADELLTLAWLRPSHSKLKQAAPTLEMQTTHKVSASELTITYGSTFQPIMTSDDEDHGETS